MNNEEMLARCESEIERHLLRVLHLNLSPKTQAEFAERGLWIGSSMGKQSKMQERY